MFCIFLWNVFSYVWDVDGVVWFFVGNLVCCCCLVVCKCLKYGFSIDGMVFSNECLWLVSVCFMLVFSIVSCVRLGVLVVSR